jgi:hypothetical protein
MSSPYVSVIRGDVTAAGRSHEAALNAWWSDEHVPKFVARDGFDRAWRLKVARRGSERGDPGPKYLAVYDIDQIDTFTLALAEDEPAWGPFHDDIDGWLVGWSRTYFRRLMGYNEGDIPKGRYWAIVKSDPKFRDLDEVARFRDWYDSTYVPEICAAPGIHGAWRWEAVPHESEIGPRRHPYWAVYSIDSPDAFEAVYADRTARGANAFDSMDSETMGDWALAFHEVILSCP